MKYMTAIFGACPTCHTEYGHIFDQAAPGDPQGEAMAALGEKIGQCQHTGLGTVLT